MSENSSASFIRIAIICIVVSLVAVVSREIITCRICVLALLCLCIFVGRNEPKFFNPYYLFSVTPFSLLIYTNLSGSIMTDLDHSTWVIAILNMSAFIVAVYFSKMQTKDGREHTGQTETNLVKHSILLIALYSVAAFSELILRRHLPISSIFIVCGIPAIICAMKSKRIGVLVIVCSIYFFLSLDSLSKASILRMAITIMIGYEMLYVSTKKQRRTIYVLTALSVILLFTSFTFGLKGKEATSSQERLDYYEQYHGVTWDSSAELLGPYAYLTTPWTNLQYVMHTQGRPHTYGLWLVRPLLGYMQVENHFKKELQLDSYSSFNTFTFIAVQYKDFGFYLSIISSILIGLFVGRYYKRCLTTNSPLEVANYVLIAQATLMMFFSNHFLMLSYPFTIVIVMWFYKNLFKYSI